MKDLPGIAGDLSEAVLHLQELVAEIRSGKIQERDDPAVEVVLGHVLDHICYVWNARELSGDEKFKLSQKEYEDMASAVPNFQLNRRLMEGTWVEKGEPNQRPEGTPGKSPPSDPGQVPGVPHP
jgi:hypothetical protein